ncbi:hypothetical protein C8J56DRAFT_888183 [Mycena floridula]|nr:hypothetical protein C8J56DRAFT_888183 [Mycena floridula]
MNMQLIKASLMQGILEVVEVSRPDGFHVAAHRGDKIGIADARVFIAFRDGIDDTTFRSWNTMKLEDSGSESIQVVEAAANDNNNNNNKWESDDASDGPPSNARVTQTDEPDTKTRKVSGTRKVSVSSSYSASSRKLCFSQSNEESETSETRETLSTSWYSSRKTKKDIAKSKIGLWDHGYVMLLPYFSSF